MKLTTLVSTAVVAASAAAKDVVCMVNDSPVATVDLDTGVCPFELPADSPVAFDFESSEDYDITFYYATVQGSKYFTDIVNEGLTIDIPANLLYGEDAAPYFQVSDSKSPAANSTAALRRRLMGKTMYARDEQSDLVDSLMEMDGTEVPGSSFAVVDVEDVSSGAGSMTGSMTGIETVTEESTTIMTITSCSDNMCHETTVPAKETVTTVTVDDEVTSYTTVCPLSTETVESTTVVTITSCADDKCHETVVPAKETVATTTVHGEETVYTTVCPLTEEPTTMAPEASTAASSEEYESTSTHYVTSYITVTSCGPEGCEEKPMKETLTTVTINGVETAYTTFCPVEEETTTSEAPEPTTEAPVTTAATTEECEECEATQAPEITPVSNSTTVAPVPMTSSLNVTSVTPGATIVCTGPDCAPDSTVTVQETITYSVAPTSEAAVSVVEGSGNVNAFTSFIALAVASLAWLL